MLRRRPYTVQVDVTDHTYQTLLYILRLGFLVQVGMPMLCCSAIHTYVLQHTLAIIRLKPLPKNSSNHAATYMLFILIIWIHNAADVFLRSYIDPLPVKYSMAF